MKIEFETVRESVTLGDLNIGDTFRLESDSKSPTVYIKTDDNSGDDSETLCVDLEDGSTIYFSRDIEVVKLVSWLKVKK